MPNEIYQALIGLKVSVIYEDEYGKELEAAGKIAAVYLVEGDMYVVVRPKEGYLIPAPVSDCYVGEGPDTIIGDPSLDWNDGVGE